MTLARALLGSIAAGESIGADVLEALAFAALDADRIASHAVRVLDDREAHRVLKTVQSWRSACGGLAESFDIAVGTHLAGLVGVKPW